MSKPRIVIISPALATANNGNRQTAYRWAQHLGERYSVGVHSSFAPIPAKTMPDAVVALHARRSARAIADYAAFAPRPPLALVLTGTDLYRDIHVDESARQSLQLADRLVVLQQSGLRELPPALRKKSMVIYQSARPLRPAADNAARRYFDAVMIGHLREEKDPATFMRAAGLVTSPHVRMLHIGAALDEEWDRRAQAAQRDWKRYRWLGALPHGQTRQRLKRSGLMVIASKMEGGANVIIEAVTSGVPVLASDISGNRGMLGDHYAGYFPAGDAAALARLIDRTANDAAFRERLKSQCAQRVPLFLPEREKAAVLELVDNLLHSA